MVGTVTQVAVDPETRAWRVKATAAFEKLWFGGFGMGRKETHAWMVARMGLASDGTIAKFDTEQCQRLIGLVEEEIKNRKSDADMDVIAARKAHRMTPADQEDELRRIRRERWTKK